MKKLNRDDVNFVSALFLVPALISFILAKVLGTPIPAYVGVGCLVTSAVLWFIAPYHR